MDASKVDLLDNMFHYGEPARTRNRSIRMWLSVFLHLCALIALLVVPLMEVTPESLPEFESIATFMTIDMAPPPPPAPPPPASRVAPAKGGTQARSSRLLEAQRRFVAPVAIADSIGILELGEVDFGVPGGVAGGIPGGLTGGVVGGLPAEPPPHEAEPVRVDFRSEAARPIHRVDPRYPDLAAQARIQGVVILEVLVGTDGVPDAIQVLRTVPMLEAAAIDAVEQWRWSGYQVGGEAVPFLVTVTVTFRLES